MRSRYGRLVGDLEDLQQAFEKIPDQVDDAVARKTIDEFEPINDQ